MSTDHLTRRSILNLIEDSRSTHTRNLDSQQLVIGWQWRHRSFKVLPIYSSKWWIVLLTNYYDSEHLCFFLSLSFLYSVFNGRLSNFVKCSSFINSSLLSLSMFLNIMFHALIKIFQLESKFWYLSCVKKNWVSA